MFVIEVQVIDLNWIGLNFVECLLMNLIDLLFFGMLVILLTHWIGYRLKR
jgi:hypothetical protein